MTDVPLQPLVGLEPAFSPSSDEYPIMVLLVDDQPMIGEAIRRALADCIDINFHYCRAAEQALAVAAQIKPTVILQDLVMPGIDGLSLLPQYKANSSTRDVPVIVLSSKEEPLVKSQSFAAGASDYLVKVPDRIELVARIRHHSKSYTNQRQRDAAYRALRESQQRLVELNLELQRLSRVDGLTGLSNRRYLDEFLSAEWRRGAREQTFLSVVMIDIDDFKKYNDTYGHVAGDEVLRKVGEALRVLLKRPADLAARYGGEEFMAILPGTPIDGARTVAEQLRLAIEAADIAHRSSTIGSRLTVSIGTAALIPSANVPCSDLIERADRALYDAKHSGKNRVVIIEPEHANEATEPPAPSFDRESR
jgi:two-component system, chemotaxis family, response regulator WspR